MKTLVIEIDKLDDFVRAAEAQQGLVFVTEGIQTDCLFILLNRQYPCVLECVVPHGTWGKLSKKIHVIAGRIEVEGA